MHAPLGGFIYIRVSVGLSAIPIAAVQRVHLLEATTARLACPPSVPASVQWVHLGGSRTGIHQLIARTPNSFLRVLRAWRLAGSQRHRSCSPGWRTAYPRCPDGHCRRWKGNSDATAIDRWPKVFGHDWVHQGAVPVPLNQVVQAL